MFDQLNHDDSMLSDHARCMLNNAWQAYYISRRKEVPSLLFDNLYDIGGFWIGASSNTRIAICEKKNASGVLLGVCVDSEREIDSDDLVEYLLCDGLRGIEERLRRMAGSFVLLAYNNEEARFYTDASATLSCFYARDGDLSCSEHLLALAHSYKIEGKSKLLRSKTPIGKSLPFNFTSYNEIKALLPNHFLDMNLLESRRFMPYDLNDSSPNATPSIDDVAEQLTERASNILEGYRKVMQADPAAALAGGWDSRLNCAIAISNVKALSAFTFAHPHFQGNHPDLTISRKVAKGFALNYAVIEDQKAPSDIRCAVAELFGPYFNPSSTIDLAWTFRRSFTKEWLMSGHVVDGVGKNHVCGAIPQRFITPVFFQEKTYSYSEEAKSASAEWMRDAEAYCDKTVILDLFSIENRLARWVTQATQLYSYLGVPVLDLFNCHESINLMLKVPIKDRNQCKLHMATFEHINPHFLDFPFNGGDGVLTRVKRSWLFLLAKTRIQRLAANF